MPLSFSQRRDLGQIRTRLSMPRTEIHAYQCLSESEVSDRPTQSKPYKPSAFYYACCVLVALIVCRYVWWVVGVLSPLSK